MFPQVPFERLALPSSFGFDNVKGNTPKQVLQGGANAYAMCWKLCHLLFCDNLVYTCEQDRSCHRAHSFLVFVGE